MSIQNQIDTPSFEHEVYTIIQNETSRESGQQRNEEDQQRNEQDNDEEVSTNDNVDKNIIFNTFINQILEENDSNEWIRKLWNLISSRFSRMPRGWWARIRTEYNKKFNSNMALTEIKNLYTRVKNRHTRQNGGLRNIEEGERNLEKNPEVKNVNLFRQVRNTLLLNISKYGEKDVLKHRTKKVYSQNVNQDVIEYINMVLRDEEIKNKIESIKDYNDIIYACQVTYDRVTEKAIKKSKWKESIEIKIEKLKKQLRIFDDYDQNKRPSEELVKLCKQKNIHSKENDKVQKLRDDIYEHIAVYEKKIRIAEKRIEYRKVNQMFEFNRKTFYRNLENEKLQVDENINTEEVRIYWENLWKEVDTTRFEFNDLLDLIEPISHQVDVTREKIKEIVSQNVKFLSNWKTPGHDNVYNFFIKKIFVLHEKLQDMVYDVIMNPEQLNEDFYSGTTYLIPKIKNTVEGKDMRPITCLPNVYKLISKCVTRVFTEICDVNNVISSNQMGTINKCQGAKEQALINKNLNSKYENTLCTSWIDIKKAYDSLHHVYLLQCLEKMEFPQYIIKFVKRTLELQETTLICNKNEIGRVRIKRGIIQGDSLSPKLFVLAMEPLSRILNRNCEKLMMDENRSVERNHLIFIDDIKLLGKDEDMLIDLCLNTKECLRKMGFEVNETKSNSNISSERTFGNELHSTEAYKYLGILENSKNVIDQRNKIIINEKLLTRVEKLCKTKLNSKNLFRAINEFSLSTVNYYVGIIPYEPSEYEQMDKEIRKLLAQYKVLIKSSNIDRLYLNRNELGRGLTNMTEKAECLLYNLFLHLNTTEERQILLSEEKSKGTHLGLIKEYLLEKYDLNEEEISIKKLRQSQKERRMIKINEKKLHSYLFENEEGFVDKLQSSLWLKQGTISPQEESMLCALQDRNLFYNQQKCHRCNQANKTVDHLATQCGRMLDFDYKKRHNDVVRSIHFWFTKKYGLNKNSKLKNYKVEKVISNNHVRIKSDVAINTELVMEHNKPDLIVHDLKTNEIQIIEVGITNKRILTNTETTKGRKYDLLGKELSMMYGGAKVTLVPVVLTWDGLVTKYYKKHMEKLNINKKVQGYIQTVVLKRTLESVMVDYKSQNEEYEVTVDMAENESYNYC